MLGPYLLQLRLMGKMVARRAVWMSLGSVFFLIGFGFFAVAFWIVLLRNYGILPAALIMGGVSCAIGLVALVIARLPPRVSPPPSVAPVANPVKMPEVTLTSIIGAIVVGVVSGSLARRR